MTITSYPFEDQDTSESQFSRLFRELQDSGVAADITALDLKVTANGSNLTLSIAAGFAIVRGHAFNSTGIETVTLVAAEADPRIDRVVLRLDPSTDSITPTVIKGSAGSLPADPPLVQTDTGIHDFPLARVLVPAAALNVSQSAVTDDRRFVGNRTGIWTTANRPNPRRKGQAGYNVTTSAWEFWDGVAWSPLTTGDSTRVAKAGDTMTGALVLPADPSLSTQAARKGYVDTQRDTRVAKTGDSMSGALTLTGDQPVILTDVRLDGADSLAGALRVVNAGATAYAPVKAGAVYDNSARVYSANNPPPPGGSVIVQTVRGVIDMGMNLTTDVTIPAVVLSKTQLRLLGVRIFNEQVSAGAVTLHLLNSTTVRAERAATAATSAYVSYELTEWS